VREAGHEFHQPFQRSGLRRLRHRIPARDTQQVKVAFDGGHGVDPGHPELAEAGRHEVADVGPVVDNQRTQVRQVWGRHGAAEYRFGYTPMPILVATLVLADDHALLRAGLRRILEMHGHTVVGEVGDGREVAGLVRQLKPDILLLDLGLPGLHGLDVLRDVRRHARKVRVLVVSAYNRDEFVVSAVRMGASGYVLKGADADELLDAVGVVASGGFYVSAQVSGAAHQAVEATPDAFDTLTRRQREVFRLMAEGLSRQQIAARLSISARTAEDHRLDVLHKLGLITQTDVVLFALRRGVISVDDAGGAERRGA
jgi:two-component system, NarL family, response regulator NreC